MMIRLEFLIRAVRLRGWWCFFLYVIQFWLPADYDVDCTCSVADAFADANDGTTKYEVMDLLSDVVSADLVPALSVRNL